MTKESETPQPDLWRTGMRVRRNAVTPETAVAVPPTLICAVVTLSHKIFASGALPADLIAKQRVYAESIGCEALVDGMGILVTQGQYAKLETYWEALREELERGSNDE